MKTYVIDAIVGRGVTGPLAAECERAGLARFTWNQWNASWAWNRKALEGCELVQLQELYQSLREHDGLPLQPADEQEAPDANE